MNDTKKEEKKDVAEKMISISQKDFENSVAKALSEGMKKLGMDKVDRKHGVFPTKEDETGKDVEKLSFASDGEKKEFSSKSGDEQKTFAKNLRVKYFLRSLFLGDNVLTKALSEGTDSAGGFLVPTEFSNEIQRLAIDYGVARRECRKWPMKRETLQIPAGGASGVSVAFVAENAQITESTPNFAQKTLTAKKLAGLTATSNELLADADVNVQSYLAELFAEAIAGKEDEELFSGDGTNFTGILVDTDVNTVTMSSGNTSFSDITFDNLIDMEAAVTSGALSGAKFIIHRTVLAIVKKIKDTTGQYIWQPPIGKAPGTLLGYPYIVAEKMVTTASDGVSTKFLSFGNLKKSVALGTRKGLEMDISKHATVGSNKLFEKDMAAVRVLERFALTITLPTALVALKTAAS